MAPIKAVKETAKTALKGKFLKSVFCSTIFVSTVFICLVLSELIVYTINNVLGCFLASVLLLFIVLPLFMGVLKFFQRMIFGAEDNVISVFSPFSSKENYKRSLEFTVFFVYKNVLVAVFAFLPAIISEILSKPEFYNKINVTVPVWVSNVFVVSYSLKIIGIVVFFFFTLRYYLAPFVFVANDNISSKEAIKISFVISKRTTADYFYLILSFIPYILASVLVIFLPFTLPYFISSYIVHSRFAVAQYNKAVDDFNNNAPHYFAGI